MGDEKAEAVVLANLVVSLGIDIPELNNLILFGAPRSMSEQMQTIGRTGRKSAAGHANIHLYPGKPRDMQIQRDFHGILGHIEDYYDRAAIHPTNPHIVDVLFGYLLGPFLTLEYAIREQSVRPGKTHILQDLHEMFDEEQSLDSNEHKLELYRDMEDIFCPEGLDLEETLQRVIEDQLVDLLIDYVGDERTPSIWREQAIENQIAGSTENINSWFKDHLDGLALRGPSSMSLNVEVQWTTALLNPQRAAGFTV